MVFSEPSVSSPTLINNNSAKLGAVRLKEIIFQFHL